MNIFICEFITGGGMYGQELPDALVHEGDMMLAAIINDLLDADLGNISITRDSRLEQVYKPVKQLTAGANYWNQWQEIMNEHDYTIIIAPENDMILYKLTRMAEETTSKLLGCNSRAVKTTSSKYHTFKILDEKSIPCVPTWYIDDNPDDNYSSWIAKPDDGVGCVGLKYIKNMTELEKLKFDSKNNGSYIIQPCMQGKPGSLSLLCNHDTALLLGCNLQYFIIDADAGSLSGIDVNGLNEYRDVLSKFASQIVKTISGLWGFVGIDFILTENGPYFLEINPRFTTSYVGLHQSLNYNPMKYLLKLVNDGRLPDMHAVEYRPVHISLI